MLTDCKVVIWAAVFFFRFFFFQIVAPVFRLLIMKDVLGLCLFSNERRSESRCSQGRWINENA